MRRWPLIGLMGYAGSGKDTVAARLVDHHGYARVAFADPLKAVARAIGWDGNKDDEGRQLLQNLGVAMRDEVHEDVWVGKAMVEVLRIEGPAVITDVRFPNEAKRIRSMGGEIWHINRPGIGPVNDHVSERAWADIAPDCAVYNSSNVPTLHSYVDLNARVVGS